MVMSRAYNANMRVVRKRFKKPRTPEEAKFMSFFGATDLYNSYSPTFDEISLQDWGVEPHMSSDIPISMSPPMSLEELSLPSISEEKETRHSVRRDALPEISKDVVPALGSDADPHTIDQDTEQSDVQLLVGLLEKMGQKVKEVKALPAGGTKITLADLMGPQKVREPELVRVGGI
jgi:hypothetical protein